MAEWAINPLFLFLLVWGGATTSYFCGLQAGLFPSGTNGVAWAILLNIMTFSLGYLTWSTFRRLDPERQMPRSLGRPLTAGQLQSALNVTLVFGLMAAVASAVRLLVLSGTHRIDLLALMSDTTQWRRAVTTLAEPDDYATRLCSIAITVTSGIFSIGFVFLGIILYFGRSKRRYAYLFAFVSVSLVVALLSLGRKEATINVMFAVLSYLFMHRVFHVRRTREVLGQLLALPAALAVLFVVVDVALKKSDTFDREGRLTGFLFSLYWYIASPLAAFAEFLKDHDGVYTMGQRLFFPFHKWLYRIGLASATAVSPRMDMLYIPYPANVYSYLRDIYEDFGFVGVAVVPYVLGVLSAGMRRRAEAFFPYLNLYMALLVVIVFSSYSYHLVSSQFYVQVIFALVFFRFRLTDLQELSE
jgi:oligosaccharide repeat unit polymerase